MIIKSLNEGFEPISSTVKPEMDDSFEKMIDEALNDAYMPDEDIKNQYSDFQVLDISKESDHSGYIELSFPNADDIDFDSSIITGYTIYEDGKVAFDKWFPEEVYNDVVRYVKKFHSGKELKETEEDLISFDDFVNEAFHVNDEYDETPEDEPTRVFFVKEKNPYTEEDEITAVFPDDVNPTNGFVTCYAHIGQHSEGMFDAFLKCPEATEEEYASLLRELETVAKYDNLIVINKPTEELDEGASLEDLHNQARHPKAPTTMPNGDPNKNPKIEIVVDGEYVATSRWYKTCKEAKEAYCKKHDVEPERVKCYRVK